MIRWLKRMLGSSGTTEPTTDISVDTGSDWTWARADEYDYDYYTDAIDDIKQLKRDQRHDEVIDLLE